MPRKSSKRSSDSSSQPPTTRQKQQATQIAHSHQPKDDKVDSQQVVYMKANDGKKHMNEMMRLQQQLQVMEKELYDMEANYLESAPPFNAIRGYESLLIRGIQNQKMSAKDDERLISASSVTGRAHINQ
eukprot:TRINITY_DN9684_c0_g1_i2.p2 TRINITY_DN9684_c0_g1~~TRINITY_DN9684_c0_g1_i2.p2  ORF type:complete len:129 (-),score=17.54 TRINITY_DN9684_c0_g1_i2:225-611(-)